MALSARWIPVGHRLFWMATALVLVGGVTACEEEWQRRVSEDQRLDREHPDHGCRRELAEVRSDRFSPLVHEVRDTTNGSFRVFVKVRHWTGTTDVSLIHPSESYSVFGGLCARELVESRDPRGKLEWPPDRNLTREYHALLERARARGLVDSDRQSEAVAQAPGHTWAERESERIRAEKMRRTPAQQDSAYQTVCDAVRSNGLITQEEARKRGCR